MSLAAQRAIFDLLTGEPRVTALCPASAIYTGSAPLNKQHDAGTVIVIRHVGSEYDHPISGPSGAARTVVQVDSYAATVAACADLAEAVRLTLQGRLGEVGGITLQTAILQDERPETIPPEPGAHVWRHRVSQDYALRYQVEIPA